MRAGEIAVVLLILAGAALWWSKICSVSINYPSANCRSNLEQLGKALHLYVQDFGQTVKYPSRDGAGFLTALYQENILHGERVYLCPSTMEWAMAIKESQIANQVGNSPCKLLYPPPKIGPILKKALTTLKGPEPKKQNIISYAGRKNSEQSKYPGIFRPSLDAVNTSIAGDDWQGSANHQNGIALFLFLDGHVDHAKDKALLELLRDPLTN